MLNPILAFFEYLSPSNKGILPVLCNAVSPFDTARYLSKSGNSLTCGETAERPSRVFGVARNIAGTRYGSIPNDLSCDIRSRDRYSRSDLICDDLDLCPVGFDMTAFELLIH